MSSVFAHHAAFVTSLIFAIAQPHPEPKQDEPLRLTRESFDKPIEVALGQSLEAILVARPGIGAQWVVDSMEPKEAVEVGKSRFERLKDSAGKPGSREVQVLPMRVTVPGKTVVKLKYGRPHDLAAGKEPLDSLKIEFEVLQE